MPLKDMFTYLFRNDEGDLQFLYLVDERWPKKITVYQKLNLELLSEVTLELDVKKTYYLTFKGPESDGKRKYEQEIEQSKQLKQLQSKSMSSMKGKSDRKDAVKDLTLRQGQNEVVQSQKSSTESMIIQQAIVSNESISDQFKHKRGRSVSFSQLIHETKKQQNLESTVSLENTDFFDWMKIFVFKFQCCNRHKEVCALLKSDEEMFAKFIQEHTKAMSDYNNKLEMELLNFKSFVRSL